MSILNKKSWMTIFLIFPMVFLMTKVTVFTTSPIDKHKLSVHFQPKGRKFHPWPNDTDCQHFKTQFATKGSLTWSSSSSLWLCSCLLPNLPEKNGQIRGTCRYYQYRLIIDNLDDITIIWGCSSIILLV